MQKTQKCNQTKVDFINDFIIERQIIEINEYTVRWVVQTGTTLHSIQNMSPFYNKSPS